MTAEFRQGVIDTAEIAATYFTALIGHGIERAEAQQMTSSYVAILVATANQKPPAPSGFLGLFNKGTPT